MAVIFQKDFEDGTLDGFDFVQLKTGTETENSISVICGDGTAYEGNCYARFAVDGDVAYERCRVGKRFADQNRVMVIQAIRYSRLPVAEGRFGLILLTAYNTATVLIASLDLINDGGIKWRLQYLKNGVRQEVLIDASSLAVATFQKHQLTAQIGETDGAVELRVDDVLVFSDYNFKNNDQGGADQYYFGFNDKSETGGTASLDLDALLIEAPEAPLPLSVTVTPASASLIIGNFVQFTAQVSGGEAPYTINWIDNASGSIISTGQAYTFLAEQVGNFEIYAQVTDNAGSTTNSAIIPITVTEAPPTPTTHILSINSTPITGIPITIRKAE